MLQTCLVSRYLQKKACCLGPTRTHSHPLNVGRRYEANTKHQTAMNNKANSGTRTAKSGRIEEKIHVGVRQRNWPSKMFWGYFPPFPPNPTPDASAALNPRAVGLLAGLLGGFAYRGEEG